ncbi:MAG: hypothetical protein GEU87_19545 [Alphaproteobacteria bacterium]|nr:hypothetical protein [Alphaproteobacteria bacterium]
MVVAALRPFRTEHDYVAGGAALNQDWPRLSDDMDIFHDNRNQLPRSVERELQALREVEFSVETIVSNSSTVEVIARKYGFETRVQWLDDAETCRRFFPAVEDESFGFRLHQADVAVNKVLCASRRNQAPRDAVDLVHIVRRYCPIGPLIWASMGKDPSLSPMTTIREIRRIAFGYSDEEIGAVRMDDRRPMARAELRDTLEAALNDARDYCENVAPIEYLGHLFIDEDDIPVAADSEAVKSGTAKAVPVRDFSVVPTVGD